MSECGWLSDRMPAVALGHAQWTQQEVQHLTLCGGCQLEPAESLRPGVQVLVKLPGLKYAPATVMWRRLERVGVEFAHPLHPLAVEEFARRLAEIAALGELQSA